MNNEFLEIKANQVLKLSEIPLIHFYDFYNTVLAMIDDDDVHVVHYLSFMFSGRKMLLMVLRKLDSDGNNGKLLVALTYAPNEYLAFTSHNKKFHLFEREIAEESDIKITGHAQLKPVRKTLENYDFYSIAGIHVHEVGVGPVHAGIIEPGHFRFSCMGERVAHLEIKLGYQHRGVEKLLCKSPFNLTRTAILLEAVTGDSAVTNALNFAEMLEGALSLDVDDDTRAIRTIALELERLSNHIGDLGALSGDVAFLPPAAYFGRMRGEFLNLLLLLSGNRFGKGLIRPSYNFYKITLYDLSYIEKKIDELKVEIKHVADLLFSTQEVIDRFEGVGTVHSDIARELGLVGVAARASNIKYDVRKSFLPGYYFDLQKDDKNITIQTKKFGDVWGRARIRYEETMDSLDVIKFILGKLKLQGKLEVELKNNSEHTVSINNKKLPPSSLILGINEGWRGELSHLMITDDQGNILRYKIKDPSFHNWSGLAYAMRDQEISDFPLCNKSFNLSYCGFDL